MLLSEFWDQRILIIISGIIVYAIQPIGMIREKGKFSKRIINDSTSKKGKHSSYGPDLKWSQIL